MKLVQKMIGAIMKNLSIRFFTMILILTLFSFNSLFAQYEKVNWKLVNKQLVHSLKSQNETIQQCAMQCVIAWSEWVNVDDAVFDVMRIFRYHEDQKVRQMALMTLYKMNNDYARDRMKMFIKFEDNPKIKRSLEYMVYYNTLEENNLRFASR